MNQMKRKVGKKGDSARRGWLERLESRRLLSAVIDEVLTIDGSAGNDLIHISVNGTDTTVNINGISETFANAGFNLILVNGLGGDDRIELTADVVHPASVNGNDGNDTIIGGAGMDTLDGGAGIDTIDYSVRTDSLTAKTAVSLPFAIVVKANGLDEDAISGFERLLGGQADDAFNIFSSPLALNPIFYVDGQGGNDDIKLGMRDQVLPTVRGGEGNDTIGGTNYDSSYGSIYDPRDQREGGRPVIIMGDAGDDVLVGSHTSYGTLNSSRRQFIGGEGIDQIIYPASTLGQWWDASHGLPRWKNNTVATGVTVSLDDVANDGPWGFDNVHSDIEIVSGSPVGDHLIAGGPGPVTLLGNNGDDVLVGHHPSDVLDGGAGNNTIVSDEVTVSLSQGLLNINGTAGSDQIVVRLKSGDTSKLEAVLNGITHEFNLAEVTSISLSGEAGNDWIELDAAVSVHGLFDGGDGNDTLLGGAGNDTFVAGLGNDSMNGGGGTDTADYSDRSTALSASQGLITSNGESDAFESVQALLTGSGNDQFNINSSGAGGIQSIDAGAGDDMIVFIRNAPGATASARGGEGNDDITISHYGGSALYNGGAGNDIFRVQRSSNTAREFIGGSGIDTLDYSAFNYPAGGVTVTLDNVANDGSDAEPSIQLSDNVRSDIEVVIGTVGSDLLVGTSGNQTLQGGNGNDTILGNGGNDLIEAVGDNGELVRLAGGTLSIIGTAGADTITVRPRAGVASRVDVIVGNRTKVLHAGSIGSLFIDSDAGHDVVRIEGIGLSTRTYLREGNDTFFGGNGSDRVYAGDGNDWIGGFGGNDILYGEAGNDRIFGGDGRDYIAGGVGSDVIRGEAGVDQILAKNGEDDFRGNAGDLITLV